MEEYVNVLKPGPETREKRAAWVREVTEKEGKHPAPLEMILEFLHARGEEGATDSETLAVGAWAEELLAREFLLDMVCAGSLIIDVGDDGEVCFGAGPRLKESNVIPRSEPPCGH